MSDPRISPLLSRLGGVYRDLSQIDRDASALLKSAVGKHLSPTIDSFVENNGTSTRTLCLNGTISIHFRAQEYQQLIDIYLPPGYPARPPTCFVRLGAPNMYLKSNHPHVGSDGQVYLPYLHEWRQFSHSLVELVVAMSSVFSADPPVFTRAAPQPQPQPQPVPPPPSYSATSSGYASPPAAASSATPASGGMSPMTRRQLEQQLAKEAEEANRVAQLARQAHQEEERQRKAQEEWDAQHLNQTREKVRKKLCLYLVDHSRQLRGDMAVDLQDQQKLKGSTLRDQIKTLKRQNGQLKEQLTVLDEKVTDIQEWLAQAQTGAAAEETPVDDVVVTEKPIHEQMLQLSAENASLTDALYFLDKALHSRVIDMTTHLKEVRRLSKRQFLVRAHLVKISQTVSMQEHVTSD